MGIVNVTPDSFYSPSRVNQTGEVLERVNLMVREGVDWVDVGGYSSRPGAKDISVAEEIDRVVPAIEAIKREFPDLIISIDTFRSEVAAQALMAGASVLNDISGGKLDPQIFNIAKLYQAPLILMHMRGTPQSMQSMTVYGDLVTEVISELAECIDNALKAGVTDVIADPGIGFSKTVEQNFELMHSLQRFTTLGVPLLVGVSRKSMIYKTLETSPAESLNGTTVLNTVGLLKGAFVLRVHDVREAREAVELITRLTNPHVE